MRAQHGDASATALRLRRDIGFLLLSARKTDEAAKTFTDLYEDLCV
ncbi:MAG TPA: hypothetical protein VIL44_12060 [Micromonospora sp.]